jgi:hypothetical protein
MLAQVPHIDVDERPLRAVDEAIESGSSAVLAGVLSAAVSREARRRLGSVLELRLAAARAGGDTDAYRAELDELREWAAEVFWLASRDGPKGGAEPAGPDATAPRPFNPYTEQSLSIARRLGGRDGGRKERR